MLLAVREDWLRQVDANALERLTLQVVNVNFQSTCALLMVIV